MRNLFFKALLAATLLSSASLTFAGTSPQTASFAVTASVANSCKITSTTAVAFAAYDPADVNFTTPLDNTGSVVLRCTKNTVATLALDQGVNATVGSTCAAPARQMASGTDRLGYGLYSNAVRTTAWGCSGNTVNSTSTGVATPATLNVYGRVPQAQDVPAGAYADTVTVSVTF